MSELGDGGVELFELFEFILIFDGGDSSVRWEGERREEGGMIDEDGEERDERGRDVGGWGAARVGGGGVGEEGGGVYSGRDALLIYVRRKQRRKGRR